MTHNIEEILLNKNSIVCINMLSCILDDVYDQMRFINNTKINRRLIYVIAVLYGYYIVNNNIEKAKMCEDIINQGNDNLAFNKYMVKFDTNEFKKATLEHQTNEYYNKHCATLIRKFTIKTVRFKPPIPYTIKYAQI